MLGYRETEIAKARADFEADAGLFKSLPVHPANIRAVKLLEAMRSQWDWMALSTMSQAKGIRTGLKYQVIDRVAAGIGLGDLTEDDFTRLQVLEAVAISAWSEMSA